MSRHRVPAMVVACSLFAASGAFAAGDRDGPPLTIDTRAAQAAIGYPTSITARPVLLVHGTDSNARESWATNYMPALGRAGLAVFTIDLPARGVVDIQESSEYVVYAVRTIFALTGRRIAVVGHSQGGLEPRWALTWWPDMRRKIDEVVTLATPHHGTYVANLDCAVPCTPAVWQMNIGAHFMAALNRGDETPGRVDYTSIFTLNDELVQPQAPRSTSSLAGGANVLVQNVCPGRPVNHVGMLRDPVVFALVLDALRHRGPADPSRVDRSTCTRATLPGVGLADALDPEVRYWAGFTRTGEDHTTTSEPPVRSYARG
jgi:triacylglycerol esterase/lipase EstA (alpha/beta hydrolase family)